MNNINMANVFTLFMAFLVTSLFAVLLVWFLSMLQLGLIFRPNFKMWIAVLTIPIVLSIVISLPYIRVSNSVIYSRRSQKAYMNIEEPSKYRSLDYVEQRKAAVADLVKKEFIEGIQNVATISPGSPIHVSTHQWIIDEVLNSPEVQKFYKIMNGDYKKLGPKVRAHNILLLINWSYICRHRDDAEFVGGVFKPRECYEITLTARDCCI